MDILNLTTEVKQHQLYFVLDPENTLKNGLRNIGQGNSTWVFAFFQDDLNSIHGLTFFVNEYFTSFENFSLLSRIFVIITDANNSIYLFEVYRKIPGLALTIELLCKQDEWSSKINWFNKKGIWTRRKDLTGVHLRIGYVPKQFYVYEKDEVKHFEEFQ